MRPFRVAARAPVPPVAAARVVSEDPRAFPHERGAWSRRLVLLSLAATAVVAALIALALGLSRTLSPAVRALLEMALILIATWIGVGGLLQWWLRDRARGSLAGVRGDWRVKFVLLATALALMEEAITTSLTNLSTALGSTPASAHITASTNYLYVIGFSSVVILVPEFVAWAFLLSRFDFRPFEVFLLYGLTGSIGEGSLAFANAFLAFWIPLYGLFVFLPAYTLPADRPVRAPRWYHYGIAVVFPFLFVVPVALVDLWLRARLGIPLFH